MTFRWTAAAAVALAWCACSGSSHAPVVEQEPADPVAKSPESRCVRPAFLDEYGPLVTIAGTGGNGNRDHNGWSPAFESGAAIDAELSRPHFAMADASGAIYVADKDAHAIRKIGVDGVITTVAGTGTKGDDGDAARPAIQARLSHPNGLWVRGDGTLYILDLDNGAIRRVDPAGHMTTLVRPPGGIPVGRGLWVADDESRLIIAASGAILEWTRGGGVEVIADGFAQLGNLFRLDSGELLAADRGGSRVYRIGPDGLETVVAGGGQRTDDCAPAVELSVPGVRAVWPHPDGGFFIGAHAGSTIWYIDASGFAHRVLDSDDGIDEVRSVTIDAAGRLIVVDDDAGFVRVMSPANPS